MTVVARVLLVMALGASAYGGEMTPVGDLLAKAEDTSHFSLINSAQAVA